MKTVYKILIIINIILFVYALGGFIAAKCIYDAVFGHRYETSEEDAFDMADFPSLSRSEHRFLSGGDHSLAGYLYESTATDERLGVVIFSHGMGRGGQRGYIDFFDALASHGYYVFAYDATGNDESDGDSVGSLLQGVIDLSSAIDYVKELIAAAYRDVNGDGVRSSGDILGLSSYAGSDVNTYLWAFGNHIIQKDKSARRSTY